jgi:hypothetical protein
MRRVHTTDCPYHYGHDCECSKKNFYHDLSCGWSYGHDCDCGYDEYKNQRRNERSN